MTIRIVASGGTGIGAKVFGEDGAEIRSISAIDISIRPDSFIEARVEVFTSGIDVKAHPLLGLDTVIAAAEAHGFRLVAIEE